MSSISSGQWQALVVIGFLLGVGLGALAAWLRAPTRDDLDAEYDRGYEEGWTSGCTADYHEQAAAEVSAVPAESVVVPAPYEAAGVAESPPAVPAGVGREAAPRDDMSWLETMHEQLAPEHISETGPQRAVVLELGPPEPGRTEGEARFAAAWEQVRWRLEMDADVAAWDQQIKAMA